MMDVAGRLPNGIFNNFISEVYFSMQQRILILIIIELPDEILELILSLRNNPEHHIMHLPAPACSHSMPSSSLALA